NEQGVARTLNNIGLINMEEDNLDTAVYYFGKELYESNHNRQKKIDTEAMDRAYTNIGIVYHKQKKLLNALDYFNKSLAIRKSLNDMDGMAISYTNIASVYDDMMRAPDSLKQRFIRLYYTNSTISDKDLDKLLSDSSLALHQKSLAMSKIVGDKEAIALSIQGIGNIYMAKGDYKQALGYLREAAAIDKAINQKKEYYELLVSASECYEKLGMKDSAYNYFKYAMAVKDTVFNEEKQKAIGREEVKYEYEKKQALADAENRRQHAIEEEQRKRQQLYIYAAVGGILLLGAFLFFVFKRLQITRRQKSIIEHQK